MKKVIIILGLLGLIIFGKKNQTKETNSDTTEFENEINQLVYQLYDLTEEEIKIVEGS